LNIPWEQATQWQELHHSLHHLISRYAPIAPGLKSLTQKLDNHLAATYPILDRLQGETCTHCCDPCCLHATIWFSLADCIYLHLSQTPIPTGQPLSTTRGHCRYATPSGCRLERPQRPWVCTWYLCPVQMRRLRCRAPQIHRCLDQKFRAIKMYRQRLEAYFIAVTCGPREVSAI
jgi:hypothetical protein